VVGIIIINLGFASFSEFEQILESEKDANHQFVYYQTDHFVYENKYNIVEYVEKFGLNTLLINDVEEYFVSNKVNGTHDKFVELDSFFTNREVKTNNDFTGLFKDKSLLLIEAESLSKMAISEELTPTLFKMMTEGMNFTGFDTPLLFGSTSDTEFMANTSIYPHSDGEVTFYNYAENSYPNSLPNKFIENGYSAISFHNHYPEFYNRDMMHNALGYQEFFVPIKMGIPAPSSDLTVLEKVKWILIPDQRFFSFFVTFNGHQPYDIELPESYQKYLDKVYEVYPDISNEYAVYLAKNMELDEAIQILIYNLIDNGRGNDVVLAVFGDHEPKGLVGEGLEEFLTVTNQTNDDNRTPFFIWSNDVEKLEIDKTSTALDILPTIFNLFEISYESDKVFGHDLLSDDYLGFSFTSTGEISGSSKSIEEYLNERKLSNWILELDYFIEKDFVIVD
jgi:phosphoglycerol transferase MdoB-like AlkP superfamily enzyme